MARPSHTASESSRKSSMFCASMGSSRSSPVVANESTLLRKQVSSLTRNTILRPLLPPPLEVLSRAPNYLLVRFSRVLNLTKKLLLVRSNGHRSGKGALLS